MNTAEINTDVDEKYYHLEIQHIRAVMKRKLMAEVEKSLKFVFKETAVEWEPGK